MGNLKLVLRSKIKAKTIRATGNQKGSSKLIITRTTSLILIQYPMKLLRLSTQKRLTVSKTISMITLRWHTMPRNRIKNNHQLSWKKGYLK